MAWPLSFDTARLSAARLRQNHFPDIRCLHTDARVMAHLGGIKTEEESAAYLERNLSHWDTHEHGVWMLTERGGAAPIGLAVLRHLDVEGVDEVETGYAFLEPQWGRGYATEILQACLAAGFERLRLPSIVAVTTPENAVSQHVLRKGGLVFEKDFRRGEEPLKLFRIRLS